MAPSVSSASTHYALVVDAGSSGSRLQIYSWRDPDLERAEILKEVQDARAGRQRHKTWWQKGMDGVKDWKGKGKEKERDMERLALRRLVRVGKGVEGDDWVKRVEPGISNMSPDDIPAYLSPLLSHALQQIPPSQHSSTPIYVLATAGMRLLTDEARNGILTATCETLHKDYPFLLDGPSCSDNVRVISGEEEGMWGWVAVNYLMDGFGHAPESTALSSSSSSSESLLPLAPLAQAPPDSSSDSVTPVDVNHHSPTFGFLDMGGASTQLAFSPSAAEIARSGYPKENLKDISLRLLSGEDVDWPVFVASWLGFGTNKVYDRYIDNLLSNWRASDGASDLKTPIKDPCLPVGLNLPSTNPSSHPGFIGTGSFATCLADLRPLLDHNLPCPAQHCLFGGVPTPHIDFEREDQRGFIGISEYWYTAQQVLGLGGVWDWGEWEKGMGEFCSRDWRNIESQVQKEQGKAVAEIELSRLERQCFKGAWISNVLHEGIGIPRLVDSGGKETLTGGDVGDTNAEAERRAREKGLLEGSPKHKSHFQSMDEVGETAISWTLGKMVIEASKAIQPRSAAVEAAWTQRLPHLHLGHMEQRLNDLGIQTIWAYGFMTFVLLVCIFNALKRRFRWTWTFFPTSPSGRRRKPSISTTTPIPANGSSWSWPWSAAKEETYSLEDGLDVTPTKPRSTSGRVRLWSLRLSNLVSRLTSTSTAGKERTRIMRHASMPLTTTSYAQVNGWQSQPSSPRGNNGFFFTPALAAPQVPTSSASSPAASPPRLKGSGRPARPRQNSSSASKLGVPEGGTGGWNDPPPNVFSREEPPSPGHSGTLTPIARSGTISRQSSRVNLSELGLAQRSASRAATPHDFDDGTHLVG